MLLPLLVLGGAVLGGLQAVRAGMAVVAGAKVLGVARRTVRANQQREALAKDARRAHVEKGEIQFTNEKA